MERINLAHSPDSDDAFMFYALATDKLDTAGFEFVHHLEDIESLNRAAVAGKYEITAVSIHAFAYLHDRYALLKSGASMGDGYGPIVVSKTPFEPGELKKKRVGIPGTRTSAFLALQLCEREFNFEVIRFDQIIPAVEAGAVDCGLIIHEGQLSFRASGLHRILDLGSWWKDLTGLPLPLGGNVVRRDLGSSKIRAISEILSKSVEYALHHRREALEYALQFARGLDFEQADRFISMYVNERTLDYGQDGRAAVQLFLDRGHEIGVLPRRVKVDFV